MDKTLKTKLKQAKTLIGGGKHNEALVLMQELINDGHDNDYYVRVFSGVCCCELDQLSGAYEHYKTAVAIDAEKNDAWQGFCKLLRKQLSQSTTSPSVSSMNNNDAPSVDYNLYLTAVRKIKAQRNEADASELNYAEAICLIKLQQLVELKTLLKNSGYTIVTAELLEMLLPTINVSNDNVLQVKFDIVIAIFDEMGADFPNVDLSEQAHHKLLALFLKFGSFKRLHTHLHQLIDSAKSSALVLALTYLHYLIVYVIGTEEQRINLDDSSTNCAKCQQIMHSSISNTPDNNNSNLSWITNCMSECHHEDYHAGLSLMPEHVPLITVAGLNIVRFIHLCLSTLIHHHLHNSHQVSSNAQRLLASEFVGVIQITDTTDADWLHFVNGVRLLAGEAIAASAGDCSDEHLKIGDEYLVEAMKCPIFNDRSCLALVMIRSRTDLDSARQFLLDNRAETLAWWHCAQAYVILQGQSRDQDDGSARARMHAQRAVDIESDNAFYRYILAENIMAGSDQKPALNELLSAAKLDPNDARVFALLARFYERNGTVNRPVKCQQRACHLQPVNVLYAKQLCHLYRQLDADKDTRAAYCDLLKRLVSTNAELLWPRIQLGMVLLAENDADGAINLLQSAVVAFDQHQPAEPDDTPWWLVWQSLGDAYLARGSLMSADRCFDQVLLLQPDNRYAMVRKAAVTLQTGGAGDNRSILLVDKLQSLGNNYVPSLVVVCETYLRASQCCFTSGRYMMALVYVEELCKIGEHTLIHVDGSLVTVWLMLAQGYNLMSKFDDDILRARQLPNEDSQISKQSDKIDVQMSMCPLRVECCRRAIACVTHSLKLLPRNDSNQSTNVQASISHSLGVYLYEMSLLVNQEQAAVWSNKSAQCFKQAIQWAKDSSEIQQQSWTCLGIVYATYSPPDCARSQHCLCRALAIDQQTPVSAQTWTALGVLYLLSGQSDRLANQAFTQAQAVMPSYAQAWCAQAHIADRCRDDDEPMDLYRHSSTIRVMSMSVLSYGHHVLQRLKRDAHNRQLRALNATLVVLDGLEKLAAVRSPSTNPNLCTYLNVFRALNGLQPAPTTTQHEINKEPPSLFDEQSFLNLCASIVSDCDSPVFSQTLATTQPLIEFLIGCDDEQVCADWLTMLASVCLVAVEKKTAINTQLRRLCNRLVHYLPFNPAVRAVLLYMCSETSENALKLSPSIAAVEPRLLHALYNSSARATDQQRAKHLMPWANA